MAKRHKTWATRTVSEPAEAGVIRHLQDQTPVRAKLIVALDTFTLSDAVELVGELSPVVSWFKVGSELFTGTGPEAVAMVRGFGANVFLDLKYHDIPNTVSRTVAMASRLGVGMLNVHVAGGEAMLRAAAEASASPSAGSHPRPVLLGVTLLTSQEDAAALPRVVRAAELAWRCGLDGVVASAREAAAIKAACGSAFVVVTPGIRPAGSTPADQRRTATPAEALAAGADYIVVGRPITASADRLAAAEAVLAEMNAAVSSPAGAEARPTRP